MRIAVSGTHYAGKTTLAEALVDALDGYELVEEPYLQLVADGFVFDDPPSADDYFEQLREWTASMAASAPRTIFDRSPLDFLAYASTRRVELDLESWLELCADGLASLDVLIFCPLEAPDRIRVPRDARPKLRRRVDERLRELVLDDARELLTRVHVLEVGGTVAARLAQAVELVDARRTT